MMIQPPKGGLRPATPQEEILVLDGQIRFLEHQLAELRNRKLRLEIGAAVKGK